MITTNENAEEALKTILKRYSEYRKTSAHKDKEGYKWEFVKKHEHTFDQLDNLIQRIDSLGSQNFFPHVSKTSIFRHLAIYHEKEFIDSLLVLYNESRDFEERIDYFINSLNKILLIDTKWGSKERKVDVPSASFFLFLKNYKKYFLFPVVTEFKKFGIIFHLDNENPDILDSRKPILRYIAWQKYCANKLVPLLKEVMGGNPDMLDAEDAMWCISCYFTDEVKLTGKLQSKTRVQEITPEEDAKRIQILRDAGVLR